METDEDPKPNIRQAELRILQKRERKDHRSQRDQGHYKKNYRFNKPELIRTSRDK